jgi:hypothetical protein
MHADSGRIYPAEEVEKPENAKLKRKTVPIPPDELSKVERMNRKDRRKWAQKKRKQARVLRAKQRRRR